MSMEAAWAAGQRSATEMLELAGGSPREAARACAALPAATRTAMIAVWADQDMLHDGTKKGAARDLRHIFELAARENAAGSPAASVADK